MKLSLWTHNGALNSTPVFAAFARGCVHHGLTVVYNDPSADVNVIWSVLWNGRMARNESVWRQGKPTIVLEVGGIKRGTTWKVGLNGINRDAFFSPSGNDNTRATTLGLKLKPWQASKETNPILICGQHEKSLQWATMPLMSQWVNQTIQTLKRYTNRPIIFRPHPRCNVDINVTTQTPIKITDSYDDFDMSFDNIHAVISWSSNPGPQAIIAGIPVFCGPSSLAYDVSNTELAAINNPIMPDREQWLNDYAHTEHTIEEIEQGFPHKYLTSLL